VLGKVERLPRQFLDVMLSYKHIVMTGLAFMTISAFWQMYDFHIPLILKNYFVENDYYAGYIMAADNVIALFLLPLFGTLSDRTRTRFGRRMPYIVFGTGVAVVSMLLIPFSVQIRQGTLFIVALACVLLSMALYRSPAVALMPDITPKPKRSKGNAVINLMGAVGGVIFLVLNMFLAPDKNHPETANYWPIFCAIAGVMTIGTIVLLLTVNEPKLVRKMRLESAAMGIDPEEAEENAVYVKYKLPREIRVSMILLLSSIALWFMGYNAITTAFSKYALLRLDIAEKQASGILMIATIGAIVSYIPIGIIASKIGRKKTIMGGIVVLAAVFGTATLYTAYSPLMYISFALAGIAWAAINVNSLPMVLEMSKGANIGKYTGYYYTFSMAAQILTPILSGALLEYGYKIFQSADENAGYLFLFPYGALFIGLAFVTMWFVRHGDSRPGAPQSKLEMYDTAD
jgi:MFS family permease